VSEHAQAIRVTTLRAAAGQFDNLVQAAWSNARDAAAADGCFGAQVTQPDGESEVVTVISRWRDQSALRAFLDSHEGIAHGVVGAFISGPVTSTHYTALPG
jgi:heme-degrading monooxygenase HmoA